MHHGVHSLYVICWRCNEMSVGVTGLRGLIIWYDDMIFIHLLMFWSRAVKISRRKEATTTTFHAHLLASAGHGARSLSLGPTPATVFLSWSDASDPSIHPSAFHLQASSEGWAVLASLRRFSWHFWRPDRHYVKQFRIRIRCHPLLFWFYCFFSIIFFTFLSGAVHIS